METPLSVYHGTDLVVCNLQQDGESRRAAIRLASAPRRAVLRITGSSGSLADNHVRHMIEGIVRPLAGCDFTIIGGGTRMLYRQPPHQVRYGITETLPLVARVSPLARVIGVIPRQNRLRLLRGRRLGGKLLVSDKAGNPYITIVHPWFDFCLLLQYSPDRGLPDWDKEWTVSLDYMEALRQDGGFSSCHLVYGGGETTERELRHIAALQHPNPWHIILLADSGGVAQQYAQDVTFCRSGQSIIVCATAELGHALRSLSFLATPRREGQP